MNTIYSLRSDWSHGYIFTRHGHPCSVIRSIFLYAIRFTIQLLIMNATQGVSGRYVQEQERARVTMRTGMEKELDGRG
jgi:hypothetical protein